jgi:AcrR family transcriptional regulator
MLRLVNSHSRNGALTPEKPRKTPSQSRSTQTVEAIFDAAIQVLLDGGLERLTTTRVAERAGVSVGSLYQYFPNKQSLVAAVLERHLHHVVGAVEAACVAAKGQPIEAMASAVTDSFISAKLDQPAISKALYSVAAEVGGAAVVARLTMRSQLALCDMLATASDGRFKDTALVAFMLSTAAIGPVQAVLVADVSPEMILAVRRQLVAMMIAYLKASALPA